MRHEELRKCHLQLRDTIEVDPEMAQMLELWDRYFKSLVLIFKYVKVPWGKVEYMHEQLGNLSREKERTENNEIKIQKTLSKMNNIFSRLNIRLETSV